MSEWDGFSEYYLLSWTDQHGLKHSMRGIKQQLAPQAEALEELGIEYTVEEM